MGKPEPDFELVRGHLVRLTPAGMEHGRIAGRLVVEVGAYARAHGLGSVYAAETGYVLFRDPDTVRAPDVAFGSREREAAVRGHRGFFPGAPDLAVDVRSPDETLAQLAAKAGEYLAAGARLVWVVDPPADVVYAYVAGEEPRRLSGRDVLTGGDVLPGFALPLAQLFADE